MQSLPYAGMKKQAVLFITDTQGTDFVGCYGGGAALGTPNLDRLAAEGIRFDRAHTTSPVCGPARSAIFTGRPPASNGVLGCGNAPCADFPTIAQRLSMHGIECACIGKWHLDGLDYFGTGKCAPGWNPEWWFDGRNYLDSLPDKVSRDLSRMVHDAQSVERHGITSEFTHAHRIADRACALLEKNKDQDFLLVVSIDEPHHPRICPEPFISAFESVDIEIPNADDTLTDKPRQQREWADLPSVRNANANTLSKRNGKTYFSDPVYLACNSYSDSQVGRVLEAMDAHAPQALTIYTTDHGDMFGHHGLRSKGPAMYEAITRVPFLVRWPGMVPVNSTSEALVSHLDIAPTLLDFFGLRPPPILSGKSLIPVFRDPGESVHQNIFMQFNRYEIDHDGFGAFAPIRCVFDGRWKLAVNLLDSDELYDLKNDPHELQNLIADSDCAKTRDQLHDVLLANMNRERDPLRGPHWGRRTWRDTGQSTWTGPTRPRPDDPDFFPKALHYETAAAVDHAVYDKHMG